MNDFITRHQDRVIGTLEGGDRLIFRGTLRQLSYGDGLGAYLGYRKVLRQKWGVFCPQVTAVVDRQAKRIAQEAGRPYQYVASAKVRKEDLLGGWLGKGGLLAGRAGSYGTRRQSAQAPDVMFRDARALREVYPVLCRQARECFAAPQVLRFLAQKSPGGREVSSDSARRIEGVRVQHRVGDNSLKMYDKAGSVLRVATTVNDAGMFPVLRRAQGPPDWALTWRKMGKAVADLARRGEVSRQANGRYLDALAVVGVPTLVPAVLEPIRRSQTCDGQTGRALRPVSPEDAAWFAAGLRGEHQLGASPTGKSARPCSGGPPTVRGNSGAAGPLGASGCGGCAATA